MRTPVLLALVIPMLLACEDPRGPVLLVQMDSALYVRDSAGLARATFVVTNLGNTPAYMEGCGDAPIAYYVDLKSGAAWHEGQSSGIRCLGNSARASQVLLPGQSYRGTFAWDLATTYRLRVLYGPGPGSEFERQASGGAFEIR